jgi:predicted TIM-barrel fold metal-dependent hydrolase
MTADMVRQIPEVQGRESKITRAVSFGMNLDQRIEIMDRAGVDVQVLSVASNQPYGPDRDRANALAVEFNDIYKQVADRYNGRFLAFGCVPLPHVDAASAEAVRCLDQLGFAGIALGTSCMDHPLDDPLFDPLWTELDQRASVVFLHPMFIDQPMCQEYNLASFAGAPMEDSVAALRLVQSGLTTRYPRLKFIIPHLGGTIPFIWSRLSAPGLREGLRALYYDNVNLAPGMLRATCGVMPSSHILIGTDFPYCTPDAYGDYLQAVADSGLPPDDIDRILNRNAPGLLNLPEARA